MFFLFKRLEKLPAAMGTMESDRVEYDYNFDTRVRRSLLEEYNTLEQSFSKLDAKLSFHLSWESSLSEVLIDLDEHGYEDIADRLRYFLLLNQYLHFSNPLEGFEELRTLYALNSFVLNNDIDSNDYLDLNMLFALAKNLESKGGIYIDFAKKISSRIAVLESITPFIELDANFHLIGSEIRGLIDKLNSRGFLNDLIVTDKSIMSSFDSDLLHVDQLLKSLRLYPKIYIPTLIVNNENKTVVRSLVLNLIKEHSDIEFSFYDLPNLLFVLNYDEVSKLKIQEKPVQPTLDVLKAVLNYRLPSHVARHIVKSIEEMVIDLDVDGVIDMIDLVSESIHFDTFQKLSPVICLSRFSDQKITFLRESFLRIQPATIRPFWIAYLDLIPDKSFSEFAEFTRRNGYGVFFGFLDRFETRKHFKSKEYVDFKNKFFVEYFLDYLYATKNFSILKKVNTITFLKLMFVHSDKFLTSVFEKFFQMFLKRKDMESALMSLAMTNFYLLKSVILNVFSYGMLDDLFRKISPESKLMKIIVEIYMSNTLDRNYASVAAFLEMVDLLRVKDKRKFLNGLLSDLKKSKQSTARGYGGEVLFLKLSKTDILFIESLIDSALNKSLSSDVKLDTDEYFSNDGEFVQAHAFYDDWEGDKDGHKSLASFLRRYGYNIKFDKETGCFQSCRKTRATKNLTLDESFVSEGFLVLRQKNPRNGRQITMYLTLPTVLFKSKYVTGAKALNAYLAINKIKVKQVVHRGHSPYSKQTFKDFNISNALSVINAGCGRFIETSELASQNPNIHHFFATRSIGTSSVNNMYIKVFNDLLLSSTGKVSLSKIDQHLRAYFKKSKRLKARFESYETFLKANNYTLQALTFLDTRRG